jgi:hypothetical protein
MEKILGNYRRQSKITTPRKYRARPASGSSSRSAFGFSFDETLGHGLLGRFFRFVIYQKLVS